MQPARIKKQAELLKYITSLRTHEELLLYVDTCHQQLDTINLVTVLYRLARIYDNTQRPEQRSVLKATLQESTAFKLLLRVIHDHFLHLHAIFSSQLPETADSAAFGLCMRKAATTGVLPTAECIHSPRKAQCLSNLMWSLDKLEIMEGPKPEGGVTATGVTGAETTGSLACDLAMAAGPLVILTLPEFTSQGLGNLLWNFAKMPSPPADVLTAIMEHSVQLLQGLTIQDVPDIQALSHSLRSIAHVRTRTTEVDTQPAWQAAVTTFLLHAAHLCIQALSKDQRDRTNTTGGPASSGAASSMPPGRQVASGQTIASIVWSYSAVLGSACGTQAPVSTLFLMIREHVLARLEADLTRSGSPHLLLGSFTEPTLSRLVEAYEVAQLLSTELLQAVLDVASMRLHRPSVATQDTLGYKPEELCVLLSACQASGVQPWSFLQSLSKRLAEYRDTTASWSPAQLLVLQRALKLQLTHVMHATAAPTSNNPNAPHAAMHVPAAPSAPHVNPRHSVRPVPQTRGPQYYYPGMLESPASAPLPVPSRLSSMTTQSLNSCISLPAAGPERNAFNSALNSILFDSPNLAQAAQAAQAGQNNGPWGGRHSGPIPRLQPNSLLHQPASVVARAGPMPYSNTAMAGGFDQPFQGYDLGGLRSAAAMPGVAAGGSNSHNLMMAAHPHVYLDTANPGGASLLQPAWVVDESGHLQPWMPADISPNSNNLQPWLPANRDLSPNLNNPQPWLLGNTTSADEAALALQHLLLAPPRGMGRQL